MTRRLLLTMILLTTSLAFAKDKRKPDQVGNDMGGRAAAIVNAPSKVSCSVAKGNYDNTNLEMPKPIIMTSNSDTFSFVSMEKLALNVLGKDEVFSMSNLSTSGGVKVDLSLDSAPEKVRAVLLINAIPKAGKSFDALFVATGTKVNFTQDTAPLFSAESLVYNLKCSPL